MVFSFCYVGLSSPLPRASQVNSNSAEQRRPQPRLLAAASLASAFLTRQGSPSCRQLTSSKTAGICTDSIKQLASELQEMPGLTPFADSRMARSLASLISALPQAARTSPTAVTASLGQCVTAMLICPGGMYISRSFQEGRSIRNHLQQRHGAPESRQRAQRVPGGYIPHCKGENSVHRLSRRWAPASSWGHRTALAIQGTSLYSLVLTETKAVKLRLH